MKKTRLAGALLAGVLAFTGVPAIPGTSAPFAVTAEAASAKLAAPANVKDAASGTTVKLTWSAVKGADAYRIYQLDAASGEYKTLKNVAKTSTSIKNLAKGTYKFRVAALVKSGSKLKAQTKSAVVSAKVTGAASSSSAGLVKFPAFGTTGKKAVSALGIKNAQYTKQTEQGVTMGVYVGTIKLNGSDCVACVLEDKNGKYFAAAVIIDQNAMTFADAYKKAKASLGETTMNMDMLGMSMYMWMNQKTEESYMLMGADSEGTSFAIYYAMSYKYAPDELKKNGTGSLEGIDLSSITGLIA